MVAGKGDEKEKSRRESFRDWKTNLMILLIIIFFWTKIVAIPLRVAFKILVEDSPKMTITREVMCSVLRLTFYLLWNNHVNTENLYFLLVLSSSSFFFVYVGRRSQMRELIYFIQYSIFTPFKNLYLQPGLTFLSNWAVHSGMVVK